MSWRGVTIAEAGEHNATRKIADVRVGIEGKAEHLRECINTPEMAYDCCKLWIRS